MKKKTIEKTIRLSLNLPLEVLVEIRVRTLPNILYLQEVTLILRTIHPVLLAVALLAVALLAVVLLAVDLLLALRVVRKDPLAADERSLPTTTANS